jgi:2-phosphosulfolactate phosphatase
VVLANGAARIVMVASVEEALALRAAGLGQVCMGEVGGRAPPGFDFGNSPFAIARRDFAGATIIQRTGAGTQGVTAARGAERLYAAALVTVEATARALSQGAPERITLVAMGNGAVVRTDEDELCAIHLRNLLEGRKGDGDALRRTILAGGEIAHFGDPTRPHMPRGDLDIALDLGRYDFAIRVRLEDGRPVGRREDPG